MKKFINILIFLFIFSLYCVTYIMIYDTFKDRKMNKQEKSALEIFEKKIEKQETPQTNPDTQSEEQPQTSSQPYTVNYNGFTILGTIEIPKLGLNTVILAEQTYSAMNLGAIKTYGVDLNEKGGFVLAAHNFRGRTPFFYYIYTLNAGDIIRISDASGRVLDYTVYEIARYVSPSDVGYFQRTDDYHLVIVTCEDGGKSRIVLRAHI